MSVYQVAATAAGSHVLLRDLIRDGEPLRGRGQAGGHFRRAGGSRLGAAAADQRQDLPARAARSAYPAGRACELLKDIKSLLPKLRRVITPPRRSQRPGIAIAELAGLVPLDNVILAASL